MFSKYSNVHKVRVDSQSKVGDTVFLSFYDRKYDITTVFTTNRSCAYYGGIHSGSTEHAVRAFPNLQDRGHIWTAISSSRGDVTCYTDKKLLAARVGLDDVVLVPLHGNKPLGKTVMMVKVGSAYTAFTDHVEGCMYLSLNSLYRDYRVYSDCTVIGKEDNEDTVDATHLLLGGVLGLSMTEYDVEEIVDEVEEIVDKMLWQVAKEKELTQND
jgi:hypothetical protein